VNRGEILLAVGAGSKLSAAAGGFKDLRMSIAVSPELAAATKLLLERFPTSSNRDCGVLRQGDSQAPGIERVSAH
jgi:hypothetical protein